MENKRLDYNRLFREILKIFFTKTEIARFNKLISVKKPVKKKTVSSLTKQNKTQMNIEIGTETDIQKQIDLLITFASERLKGGKFLSLLQNLGQYCITVGETNSAISIFEKIIALANKDKNLSEVKAGAQVSLGEIFRRKAEWNKSFDYAKKALAIYKNDNDKKGQSVCLNLIGTIYGEKGDFKKARQYFERCLENSSGSKNSEFIGKVEINLGIINDILGHYDDALSYFNRALINYQKISNFKRIAEIQHNIGMMHANTNKPGTAMKNFDKSISTSMKIGYLPILGISYLGKSYTFTKQEDYTMAEAFADKAMQICHKIDDKLSIADVYKIKGIIQRSLKNYDQAENFLNTSIRINQELGNKLNEAETSYELGVLYKDRGNLVNSKSSFNSALQYFRSLKAEPKIKEIKNQIAALAV